MSQESIIPVQLATLFGIIIVLVITGAVAGHRAFNSIEPFSIPLNFKESFKSSNLHVDGCGSECWKLKRGKENYTEIGKGTTDKIPDYAKQLPIGYLSTMGSPLTGQASCTSNINGVQRLAKSNPYGELVKKYGTQNEGVTQFTQSYAACEFGTNNIFDEDQLKY